MSLKIKIEAKFVLELNEAEIGALDAIFGYGPEQFMRAFKKELGESYVRPYEQGVYSLHKTVREVTAPALHEIAELRKKLQNALKK